MDFKKRINCYTLGKNHHLTKEQEMIVGILKEIKPQENRVCMTPSGVDVMKANGHTV